MLSVFCVALAATSARADYLIIDDDLDPNAEITQFTLEWDGVPGVAGYNVYYGRASDLYLSSVPVANTSTLVGVKGVRTVYFAVTAFNADGVECDFSGEALWH
jgi:hypothetical protein